MRRTVISRSRGRSLVVAAAPAGRSGRRPTRLWSRPGIVTTFGPGAYGTFAESMAADRHGDL